MFLSIFFFPLLAFSLPTANIKSSFFILLLPSNFDYNSQIVFVFVFNVFAFLRFFLLLFLFDSLLCLSWSWFRFIGIVFPLKDLFYTHIIAFSSIISSFCSLFVCIPLCAVVALFLTPPKRTPNSMLITFYSMIIGSLCNYFHIHFLFFNFVNAPFFTHYTLSPSILPSFFSVVMLSPFFHFYIVFEFILIA